MGPMGSVSSLVQDGADAPGLYLGCSMDFEAMSLNDSPKPLNPESPIPLN